MCPVRSTTVKGFALGMTFGALMVAGAATAKAEPPDQATIAYAAHFAGAVCEVLDRYPSPQGLIGIGRAIVADGLTPRQAGWVIALSVDEVCPEHIPVVLTFIRSGMTI